MGLIYQLTFSNGKSYVGLTATSLAQRLGQHRRDSRRSDTLLYRAWRKYGAPTAKVLRDGIANCDLAATEAAFISGLGTFGVGGYNATPGGEFPPMWVPELREKSTAALRAWHAENEVSAETRARMAAAKRGCKLTAAHRANIGGRPLTAEHREKLAAAKRGKPRSAETRARMAAARTGTKASAETRAKMSASAKARGPRKPFTAETLAKMSASQRARYAKLKDNPA